jgi:hypothetical protein
MNPVDLAMQRTRPFPLPAPIIVESAGRAMPPKPRVWHCFRLERGRGVVRYWTHSHTLRLQAIRKARGRAWKREPLP